jgi:hypothetical protein
MLIRSLKLHLETGKKGLAVRGQNNDPKFSKKKLTIEAAQKEEKKVNVGKKMLGLKEIFPKNLLSERPLMCHKSPITQQRYVEEKLSHVGFVLWPSTVVFHPTFLAKFHFQKQSLSFHSPKSHV